MSGPGQAPNYVICYLCGRKYGTKSISIHEPSCTKKWHAENKKLPKNLRRKMPTKPDYSKLSSGDFDGNYIDQMNEMSYKAAQEQLIPCGNCGRTFLPDRLGIHQKSCTVDKPAHSTGPITNKSSTERKLGYDPNAANGIPNGSESVENITNGNDQQTPHKPKVKIHKQILCGLCMNNIPSSIIQNHLVRCNEEKTRHLRDSNYSKQEHNKEPEEIPERPSTRTLKKHPDNSLPNALSGTYDIDSPDEEEEPVKTQKMKKKPMKEKPVPKGSYNLDNVMAVPDNEDSAPVDLATCELCKRRFAFDRIEKHKLICRKTTTKGRKVFDSSKQRLEGVEAAAPANYRKETPKAQSKGNWRQTHDDFIRSIRAAKQVTKHMAAGGKASDLPPPPPSLNPDYVHCEYCDRRFNREVAQRHIPKCATTMNRPKPPKQKALDIYKNKPPSTRKPQAGTHNNNQSRNDRGNSAFQNQKVRNASEQSGYKSPRVERSYQNFDNSPRNAPPSSQSKRTTNNNTRTQPSNDPYKSKTFSGINSRPAAPSNRGYSYNSMNHTGTNFFG